VKRVCVFCGSATGRDPRYRESAKELGRLLAERGKELVFGGGCVGLTGVVADEVLARVGRVTGVIPEALMAREIGHRGVQDLRIVPDMHVRKATMAGLADAFISLPGGYGTLEELFEVATWAQLGIHGKPVGLLNVAGFYDGLVRQVDRAIPEGFVAPTRRLLLAESPAALLDSVERSAAES
jgi:uncharacterized protein (TIGR00730 family)